MQPCFKPTRRRAAPNLTGGVLNLHQLVTPKTCPPCLFRKCRHFKLDSSSPGAWTRCSRCSILRRTALSNEVASEARSAQRQTHLGPTPLRNRLAACQARATCKQCQQTLDRGNFWPGDWHNRHKYGGLTCTTCEPREPGHRSDIRHAPVVRALRARPCRLPSGVGRPPCFRSRSV